MYATDNTEWTDTEPTDDKMSGSQNGILTTTYQRAPVIHTALGGLHVDVAIIFVYILNRREVLDCGAGEGSRGSAEPVL